MSELNVVEVVPGEAGALAALKAVHQLFEAEESVALIAAADPTARIALELDRPFEPAEPSLVLTTSGSLGKPRAVVLPVTALAVAASLSAQWLQSQAVWLTALPVTSIGGLNTVLRSALTGTSPVTWQGVGGAEKFSVESFLPHLLAVKSTAKRQQLAAAVSLVPTQIHRLARSNEALKALAELDYVLVGGGALLAADQARLDEFEVRLVRTYGATETAGGIVYNGQPLDEVKVWADLESQIWIDTPTLASGYRDGTVLTSPWPTGDTGTVTANHLMISGRLDDMVKVAGHKVHLQALAQSARDVIGVDEVATAAREDTEYENLPVVAFVGSASCETVEAACRAQMPAVPLRVVAVAEIPLLPNGKPDRNAIARL